MRSEGGRRRKMGQRSWKQRESTSLRVENPRWKNLFRNGHMSRSRKAVSSFPPPLPPPPSNSSIQNLPRNRLFIHQCEICSHDWWGAATRHRWRGFHGATNKFPYDDSTLTNGTMESDYHEAERHRSIFDRVPRRLQDVWPVSVCCEDVLLLNWSGARFLFCFSRNFNFEESFVLLLRVNYVWHVCWYNISL